MLHPALARALATAQVEDLHRAAAAAKLGLRGALSVDNATGGFAAPPTPRGTTHLQQRRADLEGTLAGSTATGTIAASLNSPAGELCEAPVTFTAQRQQ